MKRYSISFGNIARTGIASLLLVLSFSKTYSQVSQKHSIYRRFFIGSTFFVLANLNTGDPNAPDFAQLNFGYRLTPKDALSLEAKTWKYAWPLGIPYGNSY